jgi:hypothetical protein
MSGYDAVEGPGSAIFGITGRTIDRRGVDVEISKNCSERGAMARLNPAYGSELHLLRMLGRHRKFLDRLVLEVTKAEAIEWLDFPSGEVRFDKQRNAMWDREWQHLRFLPDGDAATALQ